MRKTLVAGAIAVVAVFAGVIYFARDPERPVPATGAPSEPEAGRAAEPKPAATIPVPVIPRGPPQRPRTSDPRLAALMVSPDNAQIEFVGAADGKVISEIDNDPNSVSYRKPLREYTYAGEQVIALSKYSYLGDQVQVVKVMVTYKPDGSVDQYRESTTYEQGQKPGK